jgi:hypothetical protein
LLIKWINKEARILTYYILVTFLLYWKMFLSIIGFLLHRYGLYTYVFYFMHLNIFFWEGVRRFHHTLKGGTKKVNDPFLIRVFNASEERKLSGFQNNFRNLLPFSTTRLCEMGFSMLTEMSLMTSNVTLRMGMRNWSLRCIQFPCALASLAERRKHRYTEPTGSGIERLAY